MEGSESEKIFDSLNLNPQLFINEILNAVDDMVNGAFEFYQQQARVSLGEISKEQSDELTKGISSIRNMIQEPLDERLALWEKYCLRHYFVVPDGFSLPNTDSSSNCFMDEDALCDDDAEFDKQLHSLREKLLLVGKESTDLQSELNVLKKQSTLSNTFAESVTEALQPFEQNSVDDMLREMAKTATRLHSKMESLKSKKAVELERLRAESTSELSIDKSLIHYSKVLSDVELEDLEKFVLGINNMIP